MKKKNKMNGLYKTGFILLLCCFPMFFAALAVAYLLDQIYLSAVFSGGGALLAFAGIIFTMFSKPKKEKSEQSTVDNSKL